MKFSLIHIYPNRGQYFSSLLTICTQYTQFQRQNNKKMSICLKTDIYYYYYMIESIQEFLIRIDYNDLTNIFRAISIS